MTSTYRKQSFGNMHRAYRPGADQPENQKADPTMMSNAQMVSDMRGYGPDKGFDQYYYRKAEQKQRVGINSFGSSKRSQQKLRTFYSNMGGVMGPGMMSKMYGLYTQDNGEDKMVEFIPKMPCRMVAGENVYNNAMGEIGVLQDAQRRGDDMVMIFQDGHRIIAKADAHGWSVMQDAPVAASSAQGPAMFKEQVDSKVKKGIEVEMEHKDTIEEIKKEQPPVKEAAKMIAEDHVHEFPGGDYYGQLAIMEKKLKKETADDSETNITYNQPPSNYKSKKLANSPSPSLIEKETLGSIPTVKGAVKTPYVGDTAVKNIQAQPNITTVSKKVVTPVETDTGDIHKFAPIHTYVAPKVTMPQKQEPGFATKFLAGLGGKSNIDAFHAQLASHVDTHKIPAGSILHVSNEKEHIFYKATGEKYDREKGTRPLERLSETAHQLGHYQNIVSGKGRVDVPDLSVGESKFKVGYVSQGQSPKERSEAADKYAKVEKIDIHEHFGNLIKQKETKLSELVAEGKPSNESKIAALTEEIGHRKKFSELMGKDTELRATVTSMIHGRHTSGGVEGEHDPFAVEGSGMASHVARMREVDADLIKQGNVAATNVMKDVDVAKGQGALIDYPAAKERQKELLSKSEFRRTPEETEQLKTLNKELPSEKFDEAAKVLGATKYLAGERTPQSHGMSFKSSEEKRKFFEGMKPATEGPQGDAERKFISDVTKTESLGPYPKGTESREDILKRTAANIDLPTEQKVDAPAPKVERALDIEEHAAYLVKSNAQLNLHYRKEGKAEPPDITSIHDFPVKFMQNYEKHGAPYAIKATGNFAGVAGKAVDVEEKKDYQDILSKGNEAAKRIASRDPGVKPTQVPFRHFNIQSGKVERFSHHDKDVSDDMKKQAPMERVQPPPATGRVGSIGMPSGTTRNLLVAGPMGKLGTFGQNVNDIVRTAGSMRLGGEVNQAISDYNLDKSGLKKTDESRSIPKEKKITLPGGSLEELEKKKPKELKEGELLNPANK